MKALSTNALQYENITKIYHSRIRGHDVRALDCFSLTVERGEIFGFLGPNGSGKTTAIHLAMGFMRPTSGTGTMLGALFGDARTRQRIGFLAENVALYHRTAFKLVRYYGALNGMQGDSLARRAHEVLQVVDLGSEENRNAGKFSRGMLQRVGLAQALVNDPELLVLDEPTSALDPLARVAVRELLLECRRAGKTVFLSSHLLSEVETICDRVAILRNGRVIRQGWTANLLESREQVEIVARGKVPAGVCAAASPEGYTVVVCTPVLRQTIEVIWNAGGEVVRVNPVRRSLEELFVETVTERADARGE